ncbi:MAG: hypothetical protein LUC48_01280 [Clostridiales bacterium]|nr:hypothetical protein [Clostridiales bacterium]
MLNDDGKRKLMQLVKTCISLHSEKRPEVVELNALYEQFRKAEGGLSKREADTLLYQRMYGVAPQTDGGISKIRFWRTGHHVPCRRSECAAFGQALGLSGEALIRFLQTYYDHSDRAWEPPFSDEDAYIEEYWPRVRFLRALGEEYMSRLHPVWIWHLNIPSAGRSRYLRHAYVLDASHYTPSAAQSLPERHVDTVAYDAEFNRLMRLSGEIPRRTMIRHLFLLTKPFISRKRMDELLCRFGYLPLTEEHTTVTGDRLDRLIIGFLALYEEQCSGGDLRECSQWLIEAYRYLDACLEGTGEKSLRFLYFKGLGVSRGTASEAAGGQRRRKESKIEGELLEWEQLQISLRRKYADTPPGFRDEAQAAAAEARIRQRMAQYEAGHSLRLASYCFPEEEVSVGQTNLLEEIHRRLTESPEPVVLYGIGGIEKSALARAYMRSYGHFYDGMLVLHVSTDICSAITDDSQVQISNMQYSREEYGSREKYFEYKMGVLQEIASRTRLLLVVNDLNTEPRGG